MKKTTVIMSSLISLLLGFCLRGCIDLSPKNELANSKQKQKRNSSNAHQIRQKKSSRHQQIKSTDAAQQTVLAALENIDTQAMSTEQLDTMKHSIDNAIICELLGIDPELAATHLEGMGAEAMNEYKEGLVRSWSSKDPIAAHQWLTAHQNLFSKKEFELMETETLCAMAHKNPDQARQFLTSLDSQEARDRLVIALSSGWSDQNIEQAFDALTTFEDYNISEDALFQSYTAIISKYAATNPTDAALLVTELENESLQQQLISPILTNLGKQNVEDAIKWGFNLQNASTRNSAITQLASQFGIEHAQPLLSAIITHQENLDPQTIEEAFWPIAETDPESAVAVLGQIDPRAQDSIAQTIVESWLRQDENAALNWLNTQQGGPGFKAGAMAAASYLAETDPVTASLWALHVNTPSDKLRLFSDALRFANSDQLSEIEKSVKQAQLNPQEQQLIKVEIEKRWKESNSQLLIP